MRAVASLFIILTVAGSAAALNPKESPVIAFGYVARVPQAPFGAALLFFRPNGVGFYADAKFGPGITEGDDYYDNISIELAESWGDDRIDTQTNPFSMNLGVTQVLSRRVGAYAGIGFTRNTTLHQYYDPLHILGNDGRYWIDGGEEFVPNFLGGLVIFSNGTWGIQLGAEGPEFGATAGVFWSSW